MLQNKSGPRISEIRQFLLRYAKENKWRIREYVSDEILRPITYYCHIEVPEGIYAKPGTATAISSESADSALAKAFLYIGNPSLDFLDP